jgi:hypothetical protein
LQRWSQALDGQRHRWPLLLESLPRYCPSELVVQQIDGQAGRVRIRGLSLSPEAPHQLASALSEELSPAGWNVQPPSQQDQNRYLNGGPWAFEVLLLAEGPVTP